LETIENIEDWRNQFSKWQQNGGGDDVSSYPFIKNKRAPFSPARRALPMLNLALISSAGAYLDGTAPFDTKSADGDLSFREIPSQIEADDLRFSARGYDPAAVEYSPVPTAARLPILRFRGRTMHRGGREFGQVLGALLNISRVPP